MLCLFQYHTPYQPSPNIISRVELLSCWGGASVTLSQHLLVFVFLINSKIELTFHDCVMIKLMTKLQNEV